MAKPKKEVKPKRFNPAVRKEITERDFREREIAARSAWSNDHASAKALGKALLHLSKAFYKHGQFTKWLRTNQIDQNRASYCMRVAQGKVKEAQRKQKDLPQTLAKQSVDKIFKLASTKRASMEQISEQIVRLLSHVITGAGKAAEWRMRKDDDPAVKQAAKNVWKALNELLDAAVLGHDLDENGNIVDRATGRVFPDAASALAAQEAAAASAGR